VPISQQFDDSYYAQVYGDYFRQNSPRKLRFYRQLLLSHMTASESPRVLDLGCAFGLFLAALPERFRKFGVDASSYALGGAAERVPEGSFAAADCGDPPLVSRFDAIAALDVLEHIPAVEHTLEFVGRSLTPGGIFLVVVPVYDGPMGPIIRTLDRDPTHVHKRSRAWWLELISRKFEVTFWTGIFRYLAGGRFYLHLPTRALRQVAPAIAIVGKLR